MSSHSSHSGSSIFSSPKSWFATKSPSHLNPLSAVDATAHNLVDGVVKNTTGWIADICNPLWAAAKNAGSIVRPSKIRENGLFKNTGKSVMGVLSHTLDSVNNLVSGSTLRGIDHAYTHTVTNSLVDITSGTTDRVPVAGKLAGNTIKGVNIVPAAPIRFFARAWEKTIDRAVDWLKSFSVEGGKDRHITTAHTTAHGGGHH